MKSPALAMARQLWTRHHFGLSISAASLLLMVITFPPILLSFDSPFVLVLTLTPACLVASYVANLLLFIDEVGSMDAGYPRRMFVLPVRTRTLVIWPMLIALVTIVALWLIIAVLIYRRGGYRPPLVLPALALAVIMAWTQTLSWMPPMNKLVRIYLAMIGLAVLVGLPCWLLIYERASSRELTVIGLIELPALCCLALLGVTHARRGYDWTFGLQDLLDRFRVALISLTRWPPNFPTPARAQLWHEDRCHGWILNGMAYFQLFSTYLMAMIAPSRPGNKLTFSITLGCMAGAPILLATFLGTTLGRMSPTWSRQRGFMNFLAVRPILTGDVVFVKYRMAARSVTHLWILVVLMTASWVFWKGYASDLADLYRLFAGHYPGWRGPAILALAALLLPIITWKHITDSLVPALTGRKWLQDGAVMGGLVVVLCLIAAGLWCGTHPEVLVRIIPLFIYLIGAWVIFKAVVALYAFRLALRRGLLRRESVIGIVAAWLVLAALTLSLVHLLLPPEGTAVPRLAALVASLGTLPLARFALAPLALDWNRHR